jgi:YVTN family beta-propeller protein
VALQILTYDRFAMRMARLFNVAKCISGIRAEFLVMSDLARIERPTSLQRWITVGVLVELALLAACGGGSSGGAPPPPPDFELGLNPPSVSIAAGNSAQTSLSVTPLNGFSGQVSIQFTNLPSGVTASPPTPTVSPGTPQTITLSAAANSTATTVTATVTGTSGGLLHQLPVSVTVTSAGGGGGGGSGPSLAGRTQYLRTDAVTEYFQWVNTHWVVLNAATGDLFVTDPFSNQIFVIDPSTQQRIATIAVPGAYSIDATPDGSTLYIGTLIGDVYTVDPTTRKVTQRYLATEIGPYGYEALVALPLANGSVALLGQAGGIPSVDGSSGFAVWNPTNNSITMYGTGGMAGGPGLAACGSAAGLHIFGFALTRDRESIITGGGEGGICELDTTTGQFQSPAVNGHTFNIFTSPDGNYLAVPPAQNGEAWVTLYNAHTLAQVAQIAVSENADVSSAAGLVFSADSTTLYVPGTTMVYAYSVATGQQVGWMPNIQVEPTSGGLAVGPISNPFYQVADSTGLLMGPAEEGVGFLDTTQLRSGPVGTAFTNGYLSPDTGPVAGGTQIQLPDPNTLGTLSAMYFGTQAATGLSATSGVIAATTPPGNPGAVGVYTFTSDGGMQLLPDGFSYGPTILETTPNMSTAEGGGTGVVYGYGFGPLNATSIPSGLTVSVAGQPAGVTGFNPDAYNILSQPFPLQSFSFTVPPGTADSTADVVVTTPAGSVTAKAAMNYLPATQQFALPGAELAQGIYDSARQLYYFTDADKIQVFSRNAGAWQPPINIPAPSNGLAQRLWGLALSPDGTKLAVADNNAEVVYLLNPSNPASVETFPIAPSEPQGIVVNPAGIAITNSGIAYIAADVLGGTGFSNYFELDTNTGILTNLNLVGPGLEQNDSYLRLELSADNSRVFFNSLGYVFSIDTSTGLVTSATADQGCCYGTYDLALSANQIQFSASDYIYDTNLNAQSSLTLNDREAQSISYVYGSKLSPDGSLLFLPSTSGMDIFDGRLGILRDRIALPMSLSPNYDALVEDGQDNILVAITGQTGGGIAVLDFSSIAEPSPLSYPGADFSKVRLREGTPSSSAETSPSPREGHSAAARPLHYVMNPRPPRIR